MGGRGSQFQADSQLAHKLLEVGMGMGVGGCVSPSHRAGSSEGDRQTDSDALMLIGGGLIFLCDLSGYQI